MVKQILQNESDDEDEDMQDFVEEAMENLQFTDEVAQFSLLEFGEDGDDDELELDDEDDLSEASDEDLPA